MDHSHAPISLLLDETLPQGRLAGVALPAATPLAALHPDERRLADSLSAPRQAAFVGGRLALRAALRAVSPAAAAHAVLRTSRGAPALPTGVLGSVSHKRRLAVALAATPDDDTRTIGVDLEEVPLAAELTRPDLAPKILTPLERHLLSELEADDLAAYREAVRLRFALKEAVYKCIDPHVARYVRFQEVEVFPRATGETLVRLSLPEFAGRDITVRAWWTRLADHLVATAAATALGS